METAKSITTISSSKMKQLQIKIGEYESSLELICDNNKLGVNLNLKKENGSPLKFEKVYTFEELIKISKWFKIFDNLEESFEDILKLVENKQIEIQLELGQKHAKIIFNINMEKIKRFEIDIYQKELTKDEMIDNLILENKEIKEKIKDLETRLNLIEQKVVNSTSYENDIMKSDIINDSDKETLNNWINVNNDKNIKLLYKASRDGDAYQDFYRLCENKGPTITIALTTKGYKIGGFTSIPWKNPNNGKNNNKYYKDDTAFIFSLNTKKKFYPKIGEKEQVCMWSDRGPSFGGGNDMALHNNCLHNNNSFNDCPYTYETGKYELCGGEKNFMVKDYEVYLIN